jgi:hypothetical protein
MTVVWTIAVVVVDDASRSILIDRSVGAGASGSPHLPTVELPEGEPSADLAFDMIEELLGRRVAPVWMHYEEADDLLVSGVGAIMVAGERSSDPGSTREFVPAEQIVDTLEPELPRGYIRAWLARLAGQRDPRTPPWLEPGWHERASRWIAERLTEAGTPPTAPTRMTYQSPIGMVLRTSVGARDIYLKCPAPQFRAEAGITRALADRTPGWVPEVIAIEPAEGLLLMADLGNRQLGNEPESAWADGLRRLGEIQRAWVGHWANLIDAGGQRRTLAMLAESVPGLLDVGGLGERLDPAFLEQWPAVRSRLVDACRELGDIGLPDALIHGDAHPWNIAVTSGGLVVFDWSDAAIGPSFVDLAVFLRRTSDLGLRRVLRDSYLEAWSGTASRDRLERATELAMTVGALYQVATYLTLVPGLPPEDQVVWAAADVHWLRNAVDALDRGLDSIDQRHAVQR